MNRPDELSGYTRSIDLLGALSLAADMALGLSAGHGVRASYIGMHVANELGLSSEQQADLFYAELLMDAGCTAWTSQIANTILGDEITARRELFFLSDPRDPRDILKWLAQYMAAGEGVGTRVRRSADFAAHGRQFMVEGLLDTSDVAARLAGRLGTSAGVQQALRSAFEQWDGAGPRQQRADSIPIVSRIVYATIFLEVFHQIGGRQAAIKLARARRGKALDPDVVDAFTRLAARYDFWRGLEDESIWILVRQMEPNSTYRYFSDEKLDDAARAFADFADLKSFYSAGHSRRVATLAEQMALSLQLAPEDIVTVRRAALVHDIGLVAVPSFVLHKPAARLTGAEWESLRLHPYHAQRILARVPAFAPVIPLVAAHHERPDGQGYFRGIGEDQIPVGARIIAAADLFDELTHGRPECAALDPEAAFGEMSRQVGTRLCADAYEALARVLHPHVRGPAAPTAAPQVQTNREPRREWPVGLTDREVEVLRLLATGANRRVMAEHLTVSEHTVRHHLEHLYGKIDVHTRVEATLFALEHNLLS
jgi:HD-GYP domain-containing protein (c-di-GMP phosphodiesterase class II)/DNA-binding CsgD family transcriptional regulator